MVLWPENWNVSDVFFVKDKFMPSSSRWWFQTFLCSTLDLEIIPFDAYVSNE